MKGSDLNAPSTNVISFLVIVLHIPPTGDQTSRLTNGKDLQTITLISQFLHNVARNSYKSLLTIFYIISPFGHSLIAERKK